MSLRETVLSTRLATCPHCAEVIGVYEPMVIVDSTGAVRETSRAAEPALGAQAVERYHLACYRARAEATAAD